MYRSDNFGGVPGFSDAQETYESRFRWGQSNQGVIVGANVAGAARDAANTPTTVLRPGLLLGQIASTGQLTNWSPTATDGSQKVHSVLMTGLRMQDLDATNKDRFVWSLASGPVMAANLIGLDYVARAQMAGRFLFDDDLPNRQSKVPYQQELAKTADYAVTAADAGTLLTNTGAVGAVIFTLPALAAGLGPFEFLAVADQSLSVASAAGNDIVTANDAQASSVGFATGGDKIGGRLRIVANAAGTRWYVELLSSNALTIS